ncbi:MAG: hypothetical protein QW279_15915, partial [Candidatus Jordarchaeaceae archaeon]
MRIFYDNGLIVETDNFNFLLDPRGSAKFQSANLMLVSHGHGDHISGLLAAEKEKKVGTSKITHEIARLARENKEDVYELVRNLGIELIEISIDEIFEEYLKRLAN